MTQLQNKTILVVGATGAFGTSLALQLKDAGAVVYGTASSAASSVRLGEHLDLRLLLDLEDSNSIEVLANYLLAEAAPLDAIILASGLVGFGSIAETPDGALDRLLKVNATGQIDLAQRLLPKLLDSALAEREPFVVSLSGVIAEAPMPGLSAYSASKTALHGYSQAAAKELRKSRIRWMDARPGHTESGLAGRAIFGTAPNFGEGMTVERVTSRIIQGILDDERDLPSSAF
jgi:NAD(P)-dependent dehydrogenase (short-subunit alcohol dehydrogenase family)